MAGHQAGIGLSYDLQRARELLQEAGYSLGAEILPLSSLQARQAGVWHSIAGPLWARWQQELGIRVEPEIASHDEVQQRLRSDPPHLCLIGWRADYPDPDNFLRLAPLFRQTGWRNPEFEHLVGQARRVHDRQERLRLYSQADRILVQEAPIMPVIYPKWQLLVRPRIGRFPRSPLGHWFWKDVTIDSA